MRAYISRQTLAGLIFFLSFIAFCSSLQASTPSPSKNYQVGILLQDRFSERNSDNTYTGFEIELWEIIAKNLNLSYSYEAISPFPKLLDALQSGKVDIGLGTISMNRERADYIDFTHSYFVSSLGILTQSQKKNSISELLEPLLQPVIRKMILLFFLVTFLFGNVMWIAERKRHSIISTHYFPGIFQAMWCCFAIQSTIGFGDIIPNRWLARVLSIPIWICGLFLVAIITAQLLAFYTSEQYLSPIQTYNDLKGKKIAVVKGTLAARVADGLGAKEIIPVNENLEELYPKIEKGEIDAFVGDYPHLANIFQDLKTKGKNPFLAPQHFYPELYAIAVNRKLSVAEPELVEAINLQILSLRDNGTIEHLKEKWFGDLEEVMK